MDPREGQEQNKGTSEEKHVCEVQQECNRFSI